MKWLNKIILLKPINHKQDTLQTLNATFVSPWNHKCAIWYNSTTDNTSSRKEKYTFSLDLEFSITRQVAQQYHFYCFTILTASHSPSPLFENSIRDPFFKTHIYCLTTVISRSRSVCVWGCPSGRPYQCLCSSTRFFKSHGLEREEKNECG